MSIQEQNQNLRHSGMNENPCYWFEFTNVDYEHNLWCSRESSEMAVAHIIQCVADVKG
jgi:hypothetical protein